MFLVSAYDVDDDPVAGNGSASNSRKRSPTRQDSKPLAAGGVN